MAQAAASSLLSNASGAPEMNEVTPTPDASPPNGVANEEPVGSTAAEETDAKTKQEAEPADTATAGTKDDAAAIENAAIQNAMSALTSLVGGVTTTDSANPVSQPSATEGVPTVGGTVPSLPAFATNSFLSYPQPPVPISSGEMQFDQLVAGSTLVFLTDRNLVPDSLFVAMAQMEPCKLGELDRCGAYKNREIGFTGLKCKYCHGQPGFGRYFPASVRSLAQTTTSQTIIKHIGHRCQYCPTYVRATVVELERQHEETAKSTEKSKKPHGGRKLFFERIWTRLHGESSPATEANGTAPVAAAAEEKPVPAEAKTEQEKPSAAKVEEGKVEPAMEKDDSPGQPSSQTTAEKNDDGDKLDNASLSGHDASNDDKKGHEVSYPLKKRKYLFRSLPTQKRKTRSDTS